MSDVNPSGLDKPAVSMEVASPTELPTMELVCPFDSNLPVSKTSPSNEDKFAATEQPSPLDPDALMVEAPTNISPGNEETPTFTKGPSQKDNDTPMIEVPESPMMADHAPISPAESGKKGASVDLTSPSPARACVEGKVLI